MRVMKIRAYAKINLALDVVSKRADGYHELDMIMAPITLHDLIYIDRIEKGIEITSNNYRMPTDERNIMYQVAKILIDRYHIQFGVKIHIFKHIPTQAGLAGGSADGAAVLKAMNQMFRLNLSLETLAHIGKEVGADIPFCIYEQIALVRGIGEKLEFIHSQLNCHLLLVKPKKAIEENNFPLVVESLGNTLEAPSIDMVEDIKKIKSEMLDLGFAGALMSGSGSCVFGLTLDEEILEKGYEYFKNKYNFVRKTRILQKEVEKY